ncbi:MAG: ATP-binding protein [Acidobacteria bacterium]|nr:ATP-binding protein [Acidobacteriota bacterium]
MAGLARIASRAYALPMAQADCSQCGGTGWKIVERNDAGCAAEAEVVASDSSAATAAARGKAKPFGPLANIVAVRCECTASDRESRLLAHARIPRRYEHCDFDNFDMGFYEASPEGAAWNRSLEQAKLVVESFARDYPAGTDAGLLVMGPCGAGKTHLAVAALKQLVLRGHDGLFYDYRELLKEIQASYNPVSQTTEMGVLERVLKAELLLLDDLGASKPSAWALETVGHILNTRYNEKRATLLTTNYLDSTAEPPRSARLPSGQGVSTSSEDTLADRVGQRIRSRLYEMCRTVEMIAPDYRKEVRQAGRVRG